MATHNNDIKPADMQPAIAKQIKVTSNKRNHNDIQTTSYHAIMRPYHLSLRKFLLLHQQLIWLLWLLLFYIGSDLSVHNNLVLADGNDDQWRQQRAINLDKPNIEASFRSLTNDRDVLPNTKSTTPNPKLYSSQQIENEQQQQQHQPHQNPSINQRPTHSSVNKSKIRSHYNNNNDNSNGESNSNSKNNKFQQLIHQATTYYDTESASEGDKYKQLLLRNKRQTGSDSSALLDTSEYGSDSSETESDLDPDSEPNSTTTGATDEDQPATTAPSDQSTTSPVANSNDVFNNDNESAQLARSSLAIQVPPLVTSPRTTDGQVNQQSINNSINDFTNRQSTLNKRTLPPSLPRTPNNPQRRSHSEEQDQATNGANGGESKNDLGDHTSGGSLPTMNVNMGSERILIKSANERPWPVTSSNVPQVQHIDSTTHAYNAFNGQLGGNFNLGGPGLNQLDPSATTQPTTSDRHHHFDLLYPPPSLSSDALEAAASVSGAQPHHNLHERQLQINHQQHQQMLMMMQPQAGIDLNARMDQSSMSSSDTQISSQICYTPISLMLVILITMTATLLVAILTHYTIKHLGRRQFDLIESTKQFDTAHQHRLGMGQSINRSRFSGQQHQQKPIFMLGPGSQKNHGLSQLDHTDQSNHANFGMIGFAGDGSKVTGSRGLSQARCGPMSNCLDHFAFDNPYFRGDDESSNNNTKTIGGEEANNRRNNHSSSSIATTFSGNASHLLEQGRADSAGLLAVVGQHQSLSTSNDIHTNHANNKNHKQAFSSTSIESPSASCNSSSPETSTKTTTLQNYASANGSGLQDFIEHHISNLHSRQVTSSVKELTISGHSPESKLKISADCDFQGPLHPHIVDLVYDPKSMANAKEILMTRVLIPNNCVKKGDLVAVDLSGQDFIGLGFDICGNVREGIFISSILGSGPARDSGLIHRGDRIKCLNISFEGITLQDARDILNCGAPYKLRLLLEKGKDLGRNDNNSGNRRNNKSQDAQRSLSGSNCSNTVKRLRSKTMNFLTDNNNHHHHHQQTSGYNNNNSSGPLFSATKSYIKKLGNLVSPSLSHTQTTDHKSSSALDDVRITPDSGDLSFQNPIVTSYSESELKSVCADQDQPGQGSLASKRHLSSGDGGYNDAGTMLDLATVGIGQQRQGIMQDKHDRVKDGTCRSLHSNGDIREPNINKDVSGG